MSAVETLKEIQESVEAIKSDAPQRFPEAASDGDYFRQGDVNIIYRDRVPSGAVTMKKIDLQLAPGTTKGSRHCLDSAEGVQLFEVPNATALQGPIIKNDAERTVTHPEHGDVVLPPGVYSVRYQRAYAEELRRVAD